MLLHVALANSRKNARSYLFSFRRVFTHPTRATGFVTRKISDGRANGLKQPSSSISTRKDEYPSSQSSLDTRTGECNKEEDSLAHKWGNFPSGDLQQQTKKDNFQKITKDTHDVTHIVPSTKWEFYQEILGLIALNPPAPFSRLMRIHQRHPALQSVESYNLLLQLSIRHNFSRHTRFLINSMALNQIEPNSNTEKLVVRHLVTNGHWKQAWQQTVKRYPSVSDIPMAVLLELLAPGTRNHSDRHVSCDSQSDAGSRSSNKVVEEVGNDKALKIPLDTLIILLERFPRLSLDELARLPLRIISYAVRGLIRNGHHEEAVLLTANHLKTLRPGINSRRVDFARDLVHQHLSSGDVKLANYKKKRRLVERLFSLHPKLSPNSKTVFLLMRYMARSKRCGIEAYLFYKDYRARWGAAVQSQEVRRRIIAYAVKQRKYGIAKEISLENSSEDPSPSSRIAVRGASDSLLPVRAWRAMYPRKGLNSRFWKRLTIRLLGRRLAWKRMLPKLYGKE